MSKNIQNMDEDKIKITCSIEDIIYYKNDWGIIKCSVDDIISGKLSNKIIVLKGTMIQPKIGNKYIVTAIYAPDLKFGDQYEIKTIINALSLSVDDKDGQQKFLSTIFTPNQVDSMYQALDNPFETLKKGDVASLVKINGCGLHRAGEWVDRFNMHYHLANIYIELEDFNLTQLMIQKLLTKYKSPEIVIETVKHNPYTLMQIDGVGWSTADKFALEGGINPYGVERVTAYIKYYLNSMGENGYSWVTPDELFGALLETLGEEVADETVVKAIHDLYNQDIVYYNNDKTKIGLSKYYNVEQNIAKELLRLRDATPITSYTDWREDVKQLEIAQGWNYTEEQLNGIQATLENNVCIVYGEAGCGKTSLVSAMLKALPNYSFAQTSLAGRAAARMSEVTGAEGYTIHRLLGYPCTEEINKDGFAFHDENPLSHQIIIVDEISMIDAFLFYNLIRAIRDGAKLIMLGDIAQLESIGCGNVAYDMINSGSIPVVHLQEIHRQAADSAIITESRKIRHGYQIINKGWVGTQTLGKLQDLTITCYNDRSNTFYNIMQSVQKRLDEKKNIMDIQVIVPVKDKGQACTYVLNNAIQELYNPASKYRAEYTYIQRGKPIILREGDKVINTKNNYKTTPNIFNGSIGMIRKITKDEFDDEQIAIIDFVGIGEVVVSGGDLSSIEPAYAITVHKMQGSQCDYCILGVDFSGYSLLTRELLYTGITRAKKHTEVIAESNALRMACSKEGVSKKQTYLKECLYELEHPKLDF